jgi:hypothetical protein
LRVVEGLVGRGKDIEGEGRRKVRVREGRYNQSMKCACMEMSHENH